MEESISNAPDQEGPDGDGRGSPAPGTGKPASVWKRWLDPQDPPLHNFCFTNPLKFRYASPTDRNIRIQYMTGWPRQFLKYTPTIIGLGLILLIWDTRNTQLFSDIMGNMPLLFIGWMILLLGILLIYGIIPFWDSLKAFGVYTIILASVAGVAFSIIFVTTASESQLLDIKDSPAEHILASGFLLMLLLGGHLVYDGMLRTENMFSKLDEKYPSIIKPIRNNQPTDLAKRQYDEFLDDFDTMLRKKILNSNLLDWLILNSDWFKVQYFFALIFVGAFVVISTSNRGVDTVIVFAFNNPLDVIIRLLFFVYDFVLVVVFFQFLVLIRFFNKILAKLGPEDTEEGEFGLTYQPDHPDGFAGYRDFGRFATRVNILLIIGGLYVVNRIYVGGFPAFIAIQKSGNTVTQVESAIWIFDYFGPLAAYLIAVFVWSYFSFWQIHRAMQRGRTHRILRAIEENDGSLPEDKLHFLEAPTWPLNIRVFTSVIIGDLIPIIGLIPFPLQMFHSFSVNTLSNTVLAF